MLGFAQFASDHTAEAVMAWKKSLKLRPDAAISQYLAKAERESSVETDFFQHEAAISTASRRSGHQRDFVATC
jgi:hypothetical protein